MLNYGLIKQKKENNSQSNMVSLFFLFILTDGLPTGRLSFLGLPTLRLIIGFSNKLFNISLVITTALSLLINDCLSSALRCWLIFEISSFALFCFCYNNAFFDNLLRIAFWSMAAFVLLIFCCDCFCFALYSRIYAAFTLLYSSTLIFSFSFAACLVK